MVGGNAIRGSRLGGGSMLGESDYTVPAARIEAQYWCAAGHLTRPNFAAESVETIPEEWECQTCGQPAGQDEDNPPIPAKNQPYKTHLDYVKERRSADDGAALLDEALQTLRQRRTKY